MCSSDLVSSEFLRGVHKIMRTRTSSVLIVIVLDSLLTVAAAERSKTSAKKAYTRKGKKQKDARDEKLTFIFNIAFPHAHAGSQASACPNAEYEGERKVATALRL